MTGLRGFPPMQVMNYARNRSSSYVRAGAYASASIPEGIKPEQLIQWLTQAPAPVSKPRASKSKPKVAPSGPSL